MKLRTLAEAAAEILAKSKTSAPAEPMHKSGAEVVDLGGSTNEKPEGELKLEDAAAVLDASKAAAVSEPMKKGDAEVQDIGGSTTDTPDGGAVAAAAASAVGKATPPGTEPDPASDEKMKTLPEDVEGEEVDEVEEITEEDIAAAREAKLAMMREKMAAMGCKEDIDAIFGAEDLSEEFRARVSTIFETAVIARAVAVVEEMEAEILEAAEESVEEIKAELEEQVDAYLNYVVEDWKEENKVAIESGMRVEFAEEFITGLKNLFSEHYVDIPEDKVSVVDALASEVEALKGQLEEQTNSVSELQKKLDEAKKADIVKTVCEGLTATQAEKVKTLAEGVEFTTECEYIEKMKIIRESYFSSGTAKVKQDAKINPVALVESEAPVVATETSSQMDRYASALSRTVAR